MSKNTQAVYYVQSIGYCTLVPEKQPLSTSIVQTESRSSGSVPLDLSQGLVDLAVSSHVELVADPGELLTISSSGFKTKKDSFEFCSQMFEPPSNPFPSKLATSHIEPADPGLSSPDPTSLTGIEPVTNQPCAPTTPKQQQQSSIMALRMLKSSSVSVYVPQSALQKSIKIDVKTFFGDRKTITLKANIQTPIDKIKKHILETLQVNPAHFYNVRLVYSSYKIQELGKTLWEEQVPENAKLLFLAQRSFELYLMSEHPTTLKLSNNNLTVQKTGDNQYSSCFGTLGYSRSGKYYWEVKLDNFGDEEDIFLGVSHRNGFMPSACPTNSQSYWGIVPGMGKKFSVSEPNLEDYGFRFNPGDTVGVQLVFQKAGGATLSFYRNGMSCGVAHQNIRGTLFPVFTLFGTQQTSVQITVDPKAPLPIDLTLR